MWKYLSIVIGSVSAVIAVAVFAVLLGYPNIYYNVVEPKLITPIWKCVILYNTHITLVILILVVVFCIWLYWLHRNFQRLKPGEVSLIVIKMFFFFFSFFWTKLK